MTMPIRCFAIGIGPNTCDNCRTIWKAATSYGSHLDDMTFAQADALYPCDYVEVETAVCGGLSGERAET